MRKLLIAIALAFSAQSVMAADIGGIWSLTFTWDGSSPGNTSWDITKRGPFLQHATGDGGSGPGVTLASIAVMKFTGGCEPAYISTNANADAMSGEMNCAVGDGHGTWSAVRPNAGVTEIDSGTAADGS